MRWWFVLLAAGCNHQPLPVGADAGARDLATPSGDLAVMCIASPVTVSGGIPHGFFDAQYGWAWYEAGDCRERPHLMLRGDDQPLRQAVFVDVRFPEQPQLGDNLVMVVLSWGEPPVIGSGHAILTRVETLASGAEIHLEGQLTVDDNGLQLSGAFSVRHCAALDEYCV
jgi:hypothetical protein